MEEKITAWVTKYALTKGVLKVYGYTSQDYPKMLTYRPGNCFAHRDQWQLTEESGIARAQEMRVNKIKSLEKQIAKLQKLQIKIIDRTK